MSGINDRVAEVAQKIHDEYPRILCECNDQTPLPWLHAVIQEAMPRCETCKHWAPDGTGKQGDCDLAVLGTSKFSIYSDDRAGLETNADFGCVEWEAKA